MSTLMSFLSELNLFTQTLIFLFIYLLGWVLFQWTREKWRYHRRVTIAVLLILGLGLGWWCWPQLRDAIIWTTAEASFCFPTQKNKFKANAKAIRELIEEARTLELKLNSANSNLARKVSAATNQLQQAVADKRAESMSPTELLVIVKDLIKLGKEILVLHAKLLDISGESLKVSHTLKPLVIAAAERQRGRAMAESFATIRADYESAAAYFESLATYTDKYPQTIEKMRKLLADEVPYIEHAVWFLSLLEDDLESIEYLAGPWLTNDLLGRIGDFVQRYEAFRKTLRGLQAEIPALPNTL